MLKTGVLPETLRSRIDTDRLDEEREDFLKFSQSMRPEPYFLKKL